MIECYAVLLAEYVAIEARNQRESSQKGLADNTSVGAARGTRTIEQNVRCNQFFLKVGKACLIVHGRYRSFVSDRSGELPVPPDAGGIGLRATLM